MYSAIELSWIFSIISNGLFLFVFIPTLYLNYKNKSGDAISFSLVYCLLLGDLFSMTSAIYKNVNPVIIYSAMFHIFLDLIVIIQIIYYRRINSNLDLEESEHLLNTNYDYNYIEFTFLYLTKLEFIFVLISTISLISSQICMKYINLADLLAWVSTFIFILARIPQIRLNYTRRSTDGLSLVSFIIINICNFFFLMSILILLIDIPSEKHIDYLIYNLQWITGSTCTVLFDIIIFYQFMVYRDM